MPSDETRTRPCGSCPYRRDVPSGVWDKSEYRKLRAYDRPTYAQPLAAFMCHTDPDSFCAGWVGCEHARRPGYELLALRIRGCRDSKPEHGVPLFDSGTEAADHGMKELENPSEEACRLIESLAVARS